MQRQIIEQISIRELSCPICGSTLNTVQQADGHGETTLFEVHCNRCRSSYNSDGTFRALPHIETLMRFGWFDNAIANGIPVLDRSERYPMEPSVWAYGQGTYEPIFQYLAAHGMLEQ